MNKSIFETKSIYRDKVKWEDYLHAYTPVEQVGSLLVKRDDTFAPLGYGGINGSKVRQIIFVVKRYLDGLDPPLSEGPPGLIMAGSVHSPNVGRISTVAKHFGLPCEVVLASSIEKAIKHENVSIAALMGANFHKAKAPYNPVIQKTARTLRDEQFPSYYTLEYGLSVEGTEQRQELFYRFMSEQFENVPEDVDTLIAPAGSCNTALSLLYGIARLRPKKLKKVILFGIAPERLKWMEERLEMLERMSGRPIRSLFNRTYLHHARFQKSIENSKLAPYKLVHYDLHATKYAKYSDRMPEKLGRIDLHPLYEGKMIRYINQHPSEFGNVLKTGKSLFWIVGGEPFMAPMEPHLGDFMQTRGKL